MPLIENPELYPAWLVQVSNNEQVQQLRGLPVFEMLLDIGIRVEFLVQGENEIKIKKPWTYIFVPVPIVDFTDQRKMFDQNPCSVIMDCHFPIMHLEQAWSYDPDDMFSIIESKDIMLHNLSLADAVTVPQTAWAADLAEVNSNVFLLPDLQEESEEAATKFMLRLNEIAAASVTYRRARKCTCNECNT